MKNDYTAFDKEIMIQISFGRTKAFQLDSVSSGLREMSRPFRTRDRFGDLCPEFRVIDRRLQALRKKGLIRFNGKGWELIGGAA